MMAVADDRVARGVPRLRLGLPLAIGAALSFGMSGAWARGLIDAGWTPGAAVTVRVWVAALILLVPALMTLRGRWAVLRNNLGMIAAYGLLAVGATQFFYFQAVAVMDVGLALLIEYTAPVAVVLWLWLRRGERPTRRSVVGAVVAFIGLVLMLDVFSGREVEVAGILWALGAMIGAAAYFLLSERTDTGLPPLALAGGGLLFGAVGLSLVGLIGVLPLVATTNDVVYRFGTVPWFVPVLAIGLLATALAYTLGIASTRLLGSRLASFVALSEVVAALFFGWLLLGQLPGIVQGIGAGLVLAGVILVKLGEPSMNGAGATPVVPPASEAGADGASAEPRL